MMLAIHNRIAELEEQVAHLKTQVAELRGYNLIEQARRIFKCTNKQAILICFLTKRCEFTRQMAIDAVYEHEGYEVNDEYDAIASVIKYVRKILRKHGMDIYTVYGQGWRINVHDQMRLREMLKYNNNGA